MDTHETTDWTEEPSHDPKPTSKRGLVIALVAFVIVLVAGFIAYGALSENAARPHDEQPAASTPNASSGAEGSQGSQGSQTSAESSVESPSAAMPKLADYDATVYTEAGEARTLSALADGKPFVMNFWATWCPYCVDEMDDYQKIVDEYEGRVSFAFIDVADGTRETVEDASAWLLDNGYAMPSYYDTTFEASYTFGAQSLPTTVVVAANGDILGASPGRIDPDIIRSTLDSLVAEG